MARVVMYLEVPDEGKDEHGNTAYDRLCDALQERVEDGDLDGYFTLTFNERPWYPDRSDLSQLSEDVAAAQGFPPELQEEGGASHGRPYFISGLGA